MWFADCSRLSARAPLPLPLHAQQALSSMLALTAPLGPEVQLGLNARDPDVFEAQLQAAHEVGPLLLSQSNALQALGQGARCASQSKQPQMRAPPPTAATPPSTPKPGAGVARRRRARARGGRARGGAARRGGPRQQAFPAVVERRAAGRLQRGVHLAFCCCCVPSVAPAPNVRFPRPPREPRRWSSSWPRRARRSTRRGASGRLTSSPLTTRCGDAGAGRLGALVPVPEAFTRTPEGDMHPLC